MTFRLCSEPRPFPHCTSDSTELYFPFPYFPLNCEPLEAETCPFVSSSGAWHREHRKKRRGGWVQSVGLALTTRDLAPADRHVVVQELGATSMILQLFVTAVMCPTAPVTRLSYGAASPCSREPSACGFTQLDPEQRPRDTGLVWSTVSTRMAAFSAEPRWCSLTWGFGSRPSRGHKWAEAGGLGWPHRSVASLGDPLPPTPQ